MVKDGKERYGVRSVVVGAKLLSVLSSRNGAMSLTELAHAADMAPAKAHRYLVGFMESGLISQSDMNGRYDLGPLALDLGLASIRRLDVVEIAYPIMVAMRDETNETTSLAVWGNRGATLVRWVPSNVACPLKSGPP
ncbi:IclR family transcriptional regulator [Amorphus sp. 3PC139-8]|uniref:IclR family transcriptional regulator n=1 Tax=Amorphus sp. 3PC139-8 TaxID=2735676 RepID=UPI00345CD959